MWWFIAGLAIGSIGGCVVTMFFSGARGDQDPLVEELVRELNRMQAERTALRAIEQGVASTFERSHDPDLPCGDGFYHPV